MQYYGMIPEHVPNPTSVTTGRGLRFTALDTLFLYYHIQPSLFKGYRKETFGGNTYDIAYPEKALFDKVYLFMQRNPFSIEWFRELRLQNLEEFDLERFRGFAAETKHKKYRDAIERASRFIVDDRGDA